MSPKSLRFGACHHRQLQVVSEESWSSKMPVDGRKRKGRCSAFVGRTKTTAKVKVSMRNPYSSSGRPSAQDPFLQSLSTPARVVISNIQETSANISMMPWIAA